MTTKIQLNAKSVAMNNVQKFLPQAVAIKIAYMDEVLGRVVAVKNEAGKTIAHCFKENGNSVMLVK